jgi:predicted nucleic acid-binding protein
MRSASVKTRVLDSWAILEWMNDRQPASETVHSLLSEAEAGRTRLLMSAINVGEVYYFLRKEYSEALAEFWREASRTFPITVEVPTLEDIWNAAVLKGPFPIAYADAFAVALAQKYNCPLMTGDPELRRVDQLELDWIGRGADPSA